MSLYFVPKSWVLGASLIFQQKENRQIEEVLRCSTEEVAAQRDSCTKQYHRPLQTGSTQAIAIQVQLAVLTLISVHYSFS